MVRMVKRAGFCSFWRFCNRGGLWRGGGEFLGRRLRLSLLLLLLKGRRIVTKMMVMMMKYHRKKK